ncbi:MAG: NUDIX domain-containing protein, partial [Acetobacteraceae bacterium]|nr:NUDIX domain-containing protein [Acetobacteraceae bacterium]
MFEVAPDLRLQASGDMEPLDPTLEAEVEHLWQAAKRDRKLFNGRVFCADRIEPARLEGHWTEYRRAVAQIAKPALWPRLRIRSLAVCGVLRCRDGVALGRREARSVYQAGEWQLPPAGSVDASAAEPGGVSWQRALLGELHEEVGIAKEAVHSLR